MLRPSDYCELDRRFVQFKHEVSTDDFALQSYDSHSAYFDWGSVGWADLLSKPCIAVLLGEPGSGRSYEFKARCQHLVEAGTPAFYLELHRLVDASPAQILGEQDAPRLHGWQRSSSLAIFFLDAVDEAKLERVSDFGLALENFSTALGPYRSRATVFISSRISEWSPETDLRLVGEKLSAGSEEIKTASNITRKKKQEKKAHEIPVYVIAPLKREQVATFAKPLGVADTPGFLAALDQRHAWEFARRPADVRFLVEYWKRHGQIGSLTDMLEESLSLLLAETEEKRHRAIKFQLSPEQARLGAEALAAATLFCRTLDFEISDAAVLGRRPGLRPLDCLPAFWTDIQSKALLDRPLFDSAIYGRVRFHHRRLAEYLAACWLRRRMENQCPPPVLHDLLFVLLPGGRRVIRPSRAPVAVWLACIGEGGWVNDLRTWLLEASPQSFLRYGDPSLLPIVFRHQIIDAFVLRFKDRKLVRIDTDRAAMSRLADPELAASLSRHLLDPNVGTGIKTELLEFAAHGGVSGCLEAALSILQTSTGRTDLEGNVIRLLAETGTPEALTLLAEVTQRDQGLAARHVGLLASTLFPRHLDVAGLRALLLSQRSTSSLWMLQGHLSQKSSEWCPFDVLEMLMGLVFTSPDTAPCFNAGGKWIRGLTSSLVKMIFEGQEIREERLAAVAKACWLIRKDYPSLEDDGSMNSIPSFEEISRRFPGLRREMFWLAVKLDALEEPPLSRPHNGWLVFHDTLHFSYWDEDVEWLLKDAGAHPDNESRAVAAWLVLEQWQWRKNSSKIVSGLLKAISDLPDLSREIRCRIRRIKKGRMLWWWYWLHQRGVFKKYFWKRRYKTVKWAVSRWRDAWNLHTKIRHIRSGKYVHWLGRLTREPSGSTRWAVEDWSTLLAKRGRRITRAVQEGCVAVWKSYEPSAIKPSDGTPWGIIVGLCGLQFLYENNLLDFAHFTPDEARRAVRYAVNEMNGYSEWIEELAEHHPDAVRSVLAECIQHEWDAAEQSGFWARHLDFIGRKKSTLAVLVSPMVARLLAGSPPANASVTSAAVDLLLRHQGMERTVLGALSMQKLASLSPESPSYLTWLLIGLQTNAPAALDHLEQRGRDESEALAIPENNFMVSLCACLHSDGRHDEQLRIHAPDHLLPQNVVRFIGLVYKFVDPSRDIRRPSGEAYSPGPRENAQSYRSALLHMLANQPDAEAEGSLRSLLQLPEFEADHDWILHLIDVRIEREADETAFRARDIRDFELHNETPPRSVADLFQTVRRRLSAIKHDVEEADQSLRMNVRHGDREVILRRFIALELSRRSNHCYTAPQESVIQVEERLDIRVENPNIVGPVVIEIKLGDLPNRTVQSLLNDLEGQLVQRYLRDESSRHGIYLIGYTGERAYWQHPESSRPLSFEEVICMLQLRADEIRNSNPAVEELRVFGIDFRPPGSRHP